ncbi:dTDP-4-dehydrorhamnose reductase [Marinomonas communis]|uniref:dTDP-4-dehydrorhamnose reductase n=1 Tax=Marinomonas communis TaxID=28254 RepID=A0A4R6X5H0_9GAMM|nr:dTDP-4-dehydrorhamnose reductase [Marinomonas communis]TDR13099.1 dTDP-4-dehydrorhamnose reductase [Marinomonas communis]
MKRVLITGCNGQVGFCLTEMLAGKVELLALDRHALDITNKKDVFEIVTEFKPDYLLNAAAYTAVDQAEIDVDLAFSINHKGPMNLAEASESVGATMLHISTDYVFKGDALEPYSEKDKVEPKGVYGKSKLEGEKAVAEYCEKHLILRTAWVFGGHGNNFVKTMLRLSRDRNEISIVSDQFGGPTYAGDIAQALISMIEYIDAGNTPEWGVYHFSGEPYVSWFEFANSIFKSAVDAKLLDKMPVLKPISSAEFLTKADRPSNSRLNCQKIHKQFNVPPSDWLLEIKNIKSYW